MQDDMENAVKTNMEKILKQINENTLKDLRKQLSNPEELAKMNYRAQCMMNSFPPKYRTDCYFYQEVQDMAAHIPTCDYYAELGYCPCEKCSKYISNKDVSSKVRGFVDNRNVE